jgi:hypothetical protein
VTTCCLHGRHCAAGAAGAELPNVKQQANDLDARLRCTLGAWLSMVGGYVMVGNETRRLMIAKRAF